VGYTSPPWLKYTRSKDSKGVEEQRISPFNNTEAQKQEIVFFEALMDRIKFKDPHHQVVFAIQYSNEMYNVMDYGDTANDKLSNEVVPADLMKYLGDHEYELSSFIKTLWKNNGKRTSGTWSQVFGSDMNARRVFTSYYMGRYFEPIVAAAKARLNFPFCVNSI
jgi:hypothetical protein